MNNMKTKLISSFGERANESILRIEGSFYIKISSVNIIILINYYQI